jgi:hypothetical protein
MMELRGGGVHAEELRVVRFGFCVCCLLFVSVQQASEAREW